MSTLVFDTETTGFVLDKKPPSHPEQPYLVELGCVLYDDNAIERACINLIVKPDGWTIPKSASDVHGITTEMANDLGVPLVVALAAFSHLAKAATNHVGHNIQFDLKVMQAQFYRLGKPFPTMNPRCTKDMAEPIMKLPPTQRMIDAHMGHKFKSPNLTECIRFFFDEELIGAHGAIADTRACARVYFEILRRTANNGTH